MAAGIADSFCYFGIVLITPFFALIIERVGYNLMWGLLGICFAVSSNIVFIISRSTGTSTFVPYLDGILYSFAFTFFGCAMWATPGFVVPVYQLTTAYGMLSSLIASTIAFTSIFLE